MPGGSLTVEVVAAREAGLGAATEVVTVWVAGLEGVVCAGAAAAAKTADSKGNKIEAAGFMLFIISQ
jgi:hypothetical protein